MGWITIETPNAIYKLTQEAHFRQTKLPKGIDAAILELDIPKQPKNMQESVYQKQYSGLFSSTRPLFTGDIDTTTPEQQRKFAKGFVRTIAQTALSLGTITPFMIFPIAAIFSSIPGGELGKTRKILLKMGVRMGEVTIPSGGEVNYRNALIAQKAEEVIAPEMQKRLKRKPVIAVVYGAAHVGIASCLERPLFRRRILSRHTINEFGWQPELEQVMELHYNSEKKTIQFQKMGEIRHPAFAPWKKRLRAHGRVVRMKIKRLWNRWKK